LLSYLPSFHAADAVLSERKPKKICV